MVRYRTVGDATATGAVRLAGDRLRGGDRGDRRSRGSPSAARPAATTASPKRRWRIARRRATSSGSELLRIATAGSVDDGKSTLIGRLLHDTKSIFEDQLESIERTSEKRGDEQTDLALLTDGLRAEREQGITIDVAYRYFATPKRKFVIADTPGHIQYTRNMVTGASTANLALLLVDARKGVLEQTRRHALLSSLLRRPAPGPLRQQNGPGRLRRGDLRRDPRGVHHLRRQARDHRPRASCRSRPWRATTWSSARPTCPGSTGSRCSASSRTSTSPPTATWSTTASRSST